MSIAGIASTGLSQLSNVQRAYQQVRGEFKQLGQDLQTGNLSQAQTDFVTLSQSVASQFGSNSPITKALNKIGQALQSGNLSAAQQAFAALPIAMVGPCAEPQPGHIGSMHTNVQHALNQLGQALQSGSLSAAQQAFSAMQQIWQQVPPNMVPGSSTNGLMSGS
jgi:predicted lipoprotein